LNDGLRRSESAVRNVGGILEWNIYIPSKWLSKQLLCDV
jgi:hypothetical protein